MGRRLGQHFLTGTWAAAKLVESARIVPADTVVEIGPGKGALTKELLKTGAHIVAIEKDEALAHFLKNAHAAELASGQLRLIEGDVRDFDPARDVGSAYVLAANIPYYITGEILRLFLSAKIPPKRLALLIQKEVAERILARDGKESILSISVKAYGTPAIAAKVARGNFSPPPAVDSAILVVDDISRVRFEGVAEDFFFSLVRAGFASKRKKLLGNLGQLVGREQAAAALDATGISQDARAETLSIDQWFALAKALQ